MRVVSIWCGFLAFTLAACVASAPGHAQSANGADQGLTAGAFLLRGRIVGVFPDNGNSTITRIGGYIQVNDSVSPEFDLSYFVTDHIAIEGETGVSHSTLTAEDTQLGNAAIGKVWSAPAVLVAQYHLLPHSRFNPYLGAGIAVLPYFGEQPAGGLVQQLSVRSEVGAALQAGFDYRFADHWYGNVDLKQLFVASYASVDNGLITSTGHVNPLIVGLGIGYKF
jgi:outer membrane protein